MPIEKFWGEVFPWENPFADKLDNSSGECKCDDDVPAHSHSEVSADELTVFGTSTDEP